jgi:hypothetical protein
MSNEDETNVIDPEENAEALAEAMGKPIQQVITILELLNGAKIKVRIIPQSVASSFDYDDGRPIQKQVRKPKFDYRKWAKDTLPKMNDLALQNIQIIDDLSDPNTPLPKGGVRLSLISLGEFRRLNKLCFPGAVEIEEDEDSQNENNVTDRARSKGIRSGKSIIPGE